MKCERFTWSVGVHGNRETLPDYKNCMANKVYPLTMKRKEKAAPHCYALSKMRKVSNVRDTTDSEKLEITLLRSPRVTYFQAFRSDGCICKH